MHEAHPRVGLRLARQALFQPRHSNQHQPDAAPVEQIAQLFQPRPLQAVGFVHNNQCGAVYRRP